MSDFKVIVYDDWLSEMLGKDVYKLNIPGCEYFVNNKDAIINLMQNKIFIYTKIEVSDVDSIAYCEKLGFNLIETNIIFNKAIKFDKSYNGNCILRFADKVDQDGAVRVGENSFLFTRFHLDPKIGSALADRLKAEWVRNYFYGKRGDYMIVGIVDGEVAGFLQLLDLSDGVLLIDLISVQTKYQRLGIAGDMIKYAENNCHGFKLIKVGTQIANMPSIRLYEKLGFRLEKATYVFHYHKDSYEDS